MAYGGCLENSWVNRPGGSNPSPSVRAMTPETNKACSSIAFRIAVFVVDSCTVYVVVRVREERNMYTC